MLQNLEMWHQHTSEPGGMGAEQFSPFLYPLRVLGDSAQVWMLLPKYLFFFNLIEKDKYSKTVFSLILPKGLFLMLFHEAKGHCDVA